MQLKKDKAKTIARQNHYVNDVKSKLLFAKENLYN